MEPAEDRDSELARRIALGDRAAFRDFVESHKRPVYALAYRIAGNHADAEDISQDVFVKMIRSAASYDGSSRLSTWVYRITANTAIDHLRRRRQAPASYREVPIDDPAQGAARDEVVSGRNPAREAEASLLRTRIERALARVSERERAAFVLRHYHDLDIKEIAEALDISLGAVKSYLFRAVRKLQKELGPSSARRPAEAFHD
jgi:RNA polymerase sigma-70 factor (ECF subfamily)